MREPKAQRDRLEKPTLIYPFAEPPALGKVLEVAPGVVWMACRCRSR